MGRAVEPLLPEAWKVLPLSVAERFGAAINSGRADLEMWRVGRAYKQLQISFRQARGNSIVEMMSSLAKMEEAAPAAGSRRAGRPASKLPTPCISMPASPAG